MLSNPHRCQMVSKRKCAAAHPALVFKLYVVLHDLVLFSSMSARRPRFVLHLLSLLGLAVTFGSFVAWLLNWTLWGSFRRSKRSLWRDIYPIVVELFICCFLAMSSFTQERLNFAMSKHGDLIVGQGTFDAVIIITQMVILFNRDRCDRRMLLRKQACWCSNVGIMPSVKREQVVLFIISKAQR